jgi:hypothetical protein
MFGGGVKMKEGEEEKKKGTGDSRQTRPEK